MRIEYYEGTKDTVKIKTYVNNILVSVSDKYYHANTDYVVSAEQSDMVFVAPNYNFIGKVYVDDLSYKQVVKEYKEETVPEIDTSTPEEHNFYEKVCEEHKLYKMGGADHENILGGLLTFPDPVYDCPYEHSGVTEEDFMTLYERRLG